MKIARLLLLILITTFLLNACKKSDPQPVAPANLIQNGDLETYPWTIWYFGVDNNHPNNPNRYTGEYSIEAASSGTHSIRIKCDSIRNDTTFCYITQRFLGATIPVGSTLTLKAKIKTVNIQGNGLSLVIRGDQKLTNGQFKEVFFATTESKTPITGTNDFKEYTVSVDAFPADIDYVYVFVAYIHKTTGTAYIDDVSLTQK